MTESFVATSDGEKSSASGFFVEQTAVAAADRQTVPDNAELAECRET